MAKHGMITKLIKAEIEKAGTNGTTIDFVTKKVAQRVQKPAQVLRNHFDVCVNQMAKKGLVERYATNAVRVIAQVQPVQPVVTTPQVVSQPVSLS